MALKKPFKLHNKVYRRLFVSLSIIFLIISLTLFTFGAHQKNNNNNNNSFLRAFVIYDSKISLILSIISILVSFFLYAGSFFLREENSTLSLNKEMKEEDVEYYEIQRKPKVEITFTQKKKNHQDGEFDEINKLLIGNDYE